MLKIVRHRWNGTVVLHYQAVYNKRSALRWQYSDTNRYIRKVGVLPIRIVKPNVASIYPSRPRNPRAYLGPKFTVHMGSIYTQHFRFL